MQHFESSSKGKIIILLFQSIVNKDISTMKISRLLASLLIKYAQQDTIWPVKFLTYI